MNSSVKENSPQGHDDKAAGLLLKYSTRADTPLNDKKNIFLHYAAGDESEAEKVTHMILDFENGIEYAVWSAEDPAGVFDNADSEEIGQMAVFIPLVTEKYLRMAQAAGAVGRFSSVLSQINDSNTAVLPVFAESEICSAFNRLFGDMHGLFINNE